MSCQEVPSDQVSVASSGNVHCNAIVTHASDSDTSDGLQSTSNVHSVMSTSYIAPSPSAARMTVAKTAATVSAAAYHHSHRPPPANLSRFAAQSPPESPPTNTRTSGGGFFIEI